MKNFKYQRLLITVVTSMLVIPGVWISACRRAEQTAEGRPILSFAIAKPVLEAHAAELPPQLKEPDETKWKTWAQNEDKVVRMRLEQGVLDSMINLLLFGTSFTNQPRVITMNDFEDPVVQARVTDLVEALRNPGNNERILFLRNLLRSRGIDPANSANQEQTRNFVLENLRRVVHEQNTIREQVDQAGREANEQTGLSERSRVFRDRGISVDTTILSSFGIEGALRDMRDRAVLQKGSVKRVAVIGPGLDFTDKGFGYDFYPLQMLQPFALYDSLLRLGLADRGKVEITAFDISQEVLEHLRRARDHAKAGANYVVQLPRESWPWAPEAVQYWSSFGSEIGAAISPIQPPPALAGLETRAVAIRPEVVLSCRPIDLNIVLEEFDASNTGAFDLIIATNVLIYYDAFEQALALQNIATLLKPGGFFLTNDWLPHVSQIPMTSKGYTPVRYGESGDWGDNVVWWQRK